MQKVSAWITFFLLNWEVDPTFSIYLLQEPLHVNHTPERFQWHSDDSQSLSRIFPGYAGFVCHLLHLSNLRSIKDEKGRMKRFLSVLWSFLTISIRFRIPRLGCHFFQCVFCYLCGTFWSWETTILGDPGAVSRVGRKEGTKLFKEPLGTASHRTISKNSSGCRLLIGHKKCFVLLCPIGEQFLPTSFREFVHDCYCLATFARFVHQACACNHRQPKRTMCRSRLQRSFGRNILELLVHYLMPNKCKNLKDMKSSCLSICTSSL